MVEVREGGRVWVGRRGWRRVPAAPGRELRREGGRRRREGGGGRGGGRRGRGREGGGGREGVIISQY